MRSSEVNHKLGKGKKQHPNLHLLKKKKDFNKRDFAKEIYFSGSSLKAYFKYWDNRSFLLNRFWIRLRQMIHDPAHTLFMDVSLPSAFLGCPQSKAVFDFPRRVTGFLFVVLSSRLLSTADHSKDSLSLG